MPIEVETKYRVADLPALERRLAELGYDRGQANRQVDCYFDHPIRDFQATDEALRLRRVGDSNYITYKGPKLDATTKTRREIEISLPNGRKTAEDAAALLEALGFTRVAEVTKQRIHSTVRWQEREIGVSVDDVAGLGDFVELEIIAEEPDVADARNAIESLAQHLGLAAGERRSYLELLSERGQ